MIKDFFAKSILSYSHPFEAGLVKEMSVEVRKLYPLTLNLTNPERYFQGKNVLGYPTMSFLQKDGKKVGWEGSTIVCEDLVLPFMQLSIDKEINFPNLFSVYKPNVIVDFGTASGGTAVFFSRLASAYSTPKVLSIDISDQDFNAASDFHTKNKSHEKVEFLFGKSSLDCLPEVRSFLDRRVPGDRVLLSFDDLHTYEHTNRELELFSPFLQSGDIILMQDTWNQGLYEHEVSPMLSVHRFLKEHKDFELDYDVCSSLTLPCNFIYGVIRKK